MEPDGNWIINKRGMHPVPKWSKLNDYLPDTIQYSDYNSDDDQIQQLLLYDDFYLTELTFLTYRDVRCRVFPLSVFLLDRRNPMEKTHTLYFTH